MAGSSVSRSWETWESGSGWEKASWEVNGRVLGQLRTLGRTCRVSLRVAALGRLSVASCRCGSLLSLRGQRRRVV